MNIQALLNSLPIMAKGMLGIFIVIIVIYICIKLLNKIFPAKSEK